MGRIAYQRLPPLLPLTVADLIKHLQTLPQDLLVAYEEYSDQVLLEASDLYIMELCPPRPDGVIQARRPDTPTQFYLVFPGN